MRNILISLLILIQSPLRAEINVYQDEYSAFNFSMKLQALGFAGSNSWFGKADENISVNSDYRAEFSAEPQVKAKLFLPSQSTLYGSYSFYYTQSIGHDAAGTTAGLTNPNLGLTEQAYIGWRSGALFSSINDDLIDLSIGQQDYRVSNYILIGNGSSGGGSRGAYWIGGRNAFTNTVIARLNLKSLKWHGFHLEKRPTNNKSPIKINGTNLEYSLPNNGILGFMYLNVDQAGVRRTDGMNVFNFRSRFSPFSEFENFTISAEYIYERTTDIMESNAGYAQMSYLWDQLLWTPKLSYRYAHFQGDDPETKKNEGYNSLATGFSDWGTWWQGEITGTYVLGNSNLISHMLRLNVKPLNWLTMDLIYYHFLFDQPRALNLSNKHFADEVNIISRFKINKQASINVVVAVAVPNKGGKQFVGGGNQTWVEGFVYAAYDF